MERSHESKNIPQKGWRGRERSRRGRRRSGKHWISRGLRNDQANRSKPQQSSNPAQTPPLSRRGEAERREDTRREAERREAERKGAKRGEKARREAKRREERRKDAKRRRVSERLGGFFRIPSSFFSAISSDSPILRKNIQASRGTH